MRMRMRMRMRRARGYARQPASSRRARTRSIALNPAATEAVSFGLAVAVFGSAIIVGITLLVYLVRVVTRKKSWRGPLVGAILMAVVLVIGYAIIASA